MFTTSGVYMSKAPLLPLFAEGGSGSAGSGTPEGATGAVLAKLSKPIRRAASSDSESFCAHAHAAKHPSVRPSRSCGCCCLRCAVPRMPRTRTLCRLLVVLVAALVCSHAIGCNLFFCVPLPLSRGSYVDLREIYAEPEELGGASAATHGQGNGGGGLAAPKLIPRIIHQTYPSHSVPKKASQLMQSWSKCTSEEWQVGMACCFVHYRCRCIHAFNALHYFWLNASPVQVPFAAAAKAAVSAAPGPVLVIAHHWLCIGEILLLWKRLVPDCELPTCTQRITATTARIGTSSSS